MKLKQIMILLLALALGLGVAGCKSEEQIQQAQSQSNLTEQGDTYINVDMRSTLSIAGEGTIEVTPQEATVTFGVSAYAESAEEAQQKNAETLTAVTTCVKGYSIGEKDISTGEISVREQYDYKANPPKLTGYEVYADLKVTVRDMTILGDLISDAFAAGATNINGPEYSAGDTNVLYQQALAQAVENAKQKADIIAQSAGVVLSVVPISITEQSAQNNPILYSTRAVGETSDVNASVSAPIEVPEMEVTAQVNVVYEITK